MLKQTKLKAILKERGITPYKLAKDCGIAHNIVYCVLNGKLYPYPAWKAKVSNYLGIPEEDLFIVDEEED